MTTETSIKDTFVFHLSWADTLSDYPAEVRYEVYDAIIRYAQSGTLAELKPLAKMAFSFIKKDMDEDMLRYVQVCKRNRENGKNGGRPKNPENPLGFDETQQNPKNPTKPKKPDNDYDNDYDSDNDDEYENENEKEKLKKGKFVFSPDPNDEWDALLVEWLEYKRQRKESYKSQASVNKLKTHLKNLADDNLNKAREIIDYSMASNYAGLFIPKENERKQFKIDTSWSYSYALEGVPRTLPDGKVIRIGFEEHLLPDGTRTYLQSGVSVPYDAPPRTQGTIWSKVERRWMPA